MYSASGLGAEYSVSVTIRASKDLGQGKVMVAQVVRHRDNKRKRPKEVTLPFNIVKANNRGPTKA